MSQGSLCDVPRPKARVIDTLAAKKRFYVRLILHRSFFLQPRFHANAIICILLMMSCIIADTMENTGSRHTRN